MVWFELTGTEDYTKLYWVKKSKDLDHKHMLDIKLSKTELVTWYTLWMTMWKYMSDIKNLNTYVMN